MDSVEVGYWVTEHLLNKNMATTSSLISRAFYNTNTITIATITKYWVIAMAMVMVMAAIEVVMVMVI